MKGRIYGYMRVSTNEQRTDRQLKALIDFGVNERDIIEDKASGKNMDRNGIQSLKNHMLREGDTLVITSLDRLSRRKEDIKKELEWMKNNGIRLKVLDIPTTLIDIPTGQEWVIDMVNNILIEVLGSIAENERKCIKERQAEGIALAKEKGVYKGRKPIDIPDNFIATYTDYKAKKITLKKALEDTHLKRATFFNKVKQLKEQGQL